MARLADTDQRISPTRLQRAIAGKQLFTAYELTAVADATFTDPRYFGTGQTTAGTTDHNVRQAKGPIDIAVLDPLRQYCETARGWGSWRTHERP